MSSTSTATSTWWAPRETAWWVGVLFAVGSACFALGALPGYLALVGPEATGVTFFVGSIFFTTAAFLQFRQTPHTARIDRWAGGVQLVGTLFFNITTFRALDHSLSSPSYDRAVWAPDFFGCVCFLVASELAYVEVGRAAWSWRPGSRSWRIAALNLGGSVAFGISGVASYVVPSTGEVRNMTLVNLGTFVGALGFLIGGLELLPARVRPDERSSAGVSPSTGDPIAGGT